MNEARYPSVREEVKTRRNLRLSLITDVIKGDDEENNLFSIELTEIKRPTCIVIVVARTRHDLSLKGWPFSNVFVTPGLCRSGYPSVGGAASR